MLFILIVDEQTTVILKSSASAVLFHVFVVLPPFSYLEKTQQRALLAAVTCVLRARRTSPPSVLSPNMMYSSLKSATAYLLSVYH